MSITLNSKLLRRTAVALAAAASLAISLTVSAQSGNLLKRSTGETICTYSQVNVTPLGGVTVTCDGTTPVVQPGSFTLSGPPANLALASEGTMTITRSGGASGAATVSFTTSGGCGPLTGTVSFLDGATTGSYPIRTPGFDTVCTSSIVSPSIGTLGAPSTVNVGVGAGIIPVVVVPVTQPGCPTPPSDTLDFDLKLSGADRLIMASGRIASAVLPGVKANGGTLDSGKIIFGESTIAPRGGAVEISVTKCRGVIDPNPANGAACYLRSTNIAFTKMEWIERPIWGASTDGVVVSYNLCKAYLTDGRFYVNVRYSYSPSQCDWGNCGFVNQWNYATF
jgi:hypothetical protein